MKIMKVLKRSILSVCCLLGLYGCSDDNYRNEVLDSETYLNWIKKHPISWQKEIDNFTTKLIYIPKDLKLLLDFKGEYDLLNDSLISEYDNYEFFRLTINHNQYKEDLLNYKLTSNTEATARLYYLLSDISKDIFIKSETDTTYCIDAYYERTYGLSKDISVLLSFNRNELKGDERVLVYDERMFNLGKINFKLKEEELLNIPTLNSIIK